MQHQRCLRDEGVMIAVERPPQGSCQTSQQPSLAQQQSLLGVGTGVKHTAVNYIN